MLIVQKYGGSSLQDADRIKRIAERILKTHGSGHEVVVVCSAMGDTSDDLIDLANKVSTAPPVREMDMLLTSGERVSNALMAMAIHERGGSAHSLSGAQAGVFTDSDHGRARIVDVVPSRVRQVLDQGSIALVAGFQGVSRDTGDTTTLGRGGSDVTAVALAAALKADVCEIYTDVDGVFSADPRIVDSARLIETISYAEMLEMSATGAKVLMSRCVEYGRRHDVDICVRSSFTDRPGTLVSHSVEDTAVEGFCVTGVTHTRSISKIVVEDIPAELSAVAHIFEAMASAGISIDMLQNLGAPQRTELTFTVAGEDGPRAQELLEQHRTRIGYGSVRCDAGMGQVSLVGAGIRSEPGIVATLCRTLAGIGIGVPLISVSEIRVSALCRADQLDEAVRALHRSFGLDSAVPAVVYAGTGR
ncbi:aspartate kinase [Streptomyces natalensis]|uniref:Aspartokinase n=1 Tax=Streptomyces natalensis ATCC 27448 TaxID=1240678 RepID=A0A0D7CDS1_9ACTN|nr:aspartate kinase [Streptomyces natalensis]KIZ14384.1 aspartate kinase [Streptomyces natalensis ATCC 27448]